MKKYTISILLIFYINSLFCQNNLISKDIDNKISRIYQFFYKDKIEKSFLGLIQIISESPDYIFSDSSYYFGETYNNFPDGFGISYNKKRKNLYIGQYIKSKREGFGYNLSKNQLHIGYYKGNFEEGYGNIYGLKDTNNFEYNMKLLLEGDFKNIIQEHNVQYEYTGVFKDIGKLKNETLYGRKIYNDNNSQIIQNGVFFAGKLLQPAMKIIIPKNKSGLSIYYASAALNKAGYFEAIHTFHPDSLPDVLSIKVAGEEIDTLNFKKFKGKIVVFRNDNDSPIFTREGIFNEGSLNGLNGFGKEYTFEQKYEGNFLNGIRHGKGKITYSTPFDGNYFEGEFVNGERKYGTEYIANLNKYIKGNWLNGKPDGKVIITENGKTTIENWINGQKQKF